jgi:hypothetical protein
MTILNKKRDLRRKEELEKHRNQKLNEGEKVPKDGF